MYLRRILVALGLLATAGMSHAADNISKLRTALGQVPETALTANDPMAVVFLDIAANAAAEGGALSDGALRRMILARPIRPLDTLAYGLGANWTQKAGIAFDNISYFAAYGEPPMRVSSWGLKDAAAVEGLFGTLRDMGFKGVSTGLKILANGDPRRVSITSRDPENPWIGPLGQSSFVAALDNAAIQSTGPDELEQVVAATRHVADNAFVKAALDGLARAPATERGGVVQAAVITPRFGISAADPADLLLSDPADVETIRAAIEASLAAGSEGLPIYLAGIIAEIQLDDGPALAISLGYADCETAEIAVAALKARWDAGMEKRRPAAMRGQTVAGRDGTCAAVATFARASEAQSPNPALNEFLNRYIRRDFNLLQIGLTR